MLRADVLPEHFAVACVEVAGIARESLFSLCQPLVLDLRLVFDRRNFETNLTLNHDLRLEQVLFLIHAVHLDNVALFVLHVEDAAGELWLPFS